MKYINLQSNKQSIIWLINILFVFLLYNSVSAQTVNLTSSNLPIVIIDSGTSTINDTEKVEANMKIVYRGDGAITQLSDQNNATYAEYDGKIGINIRGSSSADFPKKQYSIELWDALGENNPQSFLDFPKEHDFILQAPYIDKTMMRNVLVYEMSNKMGQYAVRTKFCEVILDGEYIGVYVFMERIKIDDDRLPLENLDPLLDNTYPDITGGYVWKVDKGEDGFATSETDRYRFHDPKEENLSTQQKDYLQTEIEAFEAIMNSANAANPINGYASKIDVATWVDQFLLQEFTKNPDAYGSSMYYHKYRNGKLRMGPVWDLNLALGASYHGLAHYSSSWTTTFGHALIGPSYNQDLFNDPSFQCLMHDRWFDLRQVGQQMNQNTIFGIIDSIANLLNQGAQQRNFAKWNNLGQQIWLEAPGYANRDTYDKEVDYLKEWISERLEWVDSNIEQGSCPATSTTNLVINEIMYHPAVSGTESEGDFEFIELHNKGNTTINLAGIQFSMGIHYTFSSGFLGPNQYLVLAGNSTTFQQRYGFAPFGQYEGGISNGGEQLILADTYGYVIDEVNYDDELPWSLNADGQGSSLELINSSLDNDNSDNWFANFEAGGSPGEANVQIGISCTPAPASIVINEINYNSSVNSDSGDWVELYNNSGATVNLSGWTFQDEGATFNIPTGTTIAANSYLVLVQDIVKFTTVHPTVSNYIGQLGFGLSNGGEQVMLSDDRGCIVDVVEYDDASPWVITPDGTGKTLQLEDVNSDNSQANNWSASSINSGTPGAVNSNSGGSQGTQIKVFLEGFYIANTGKMNINLLNNNIIPTTNPYNVAPFYFFGNTSVSSFPSNTVDWVLVELRDLSNPSTILERKALLLRNDGYIMETSGSTNIQFNLTGMFRIAVYHKSHLGILSSNIILTNNGNLYDFSTGATKAEGFKQQTLIGSRATMFSGDFDGNGLINNLDYNKWSNASAAINQYLNWDADGNGIINNLDYNLWDRNKSKVGIAAIQF